MARCAALYLRRESPHARSLSELAAIPARSELTFIFFTARAALPRSLRTFVDNRSINQLFRAIVVQFFDYPELRPDLSQGHFTGDPSKVFVLDAAGDAFAFKYVLKVVDRDQRLG